MRWSDVFQQKGWGTLYLGNHDRLRMVSAGAMTATHSASLREMLFTFTAMPVDCPTGMEMGMTNIRFDKMEVTTRISRPGISTR